MSKTIINLKVTGNHPHSGDKGYFEVVDGVAETIRFGYHDPMVLVKLVDCHHDNTEACYADRADFDVADEDLAAYRAVKYQRVR